MEDHVERPPARFNVRRSLFTIGLISWVAVEPKKIVGMRQEGGMDEGRLRLIIQEIDVLQDAPLQASTGIT